MKTPIREFLDMCSDSQIRDLLDNLISTYVSRAEVARQVPTLKFDGRETQKRQARLLDECDADWAVRTVILNMGRVLYYTKDEMHPYNQDRLLELTQQMASYVSNPLFGQTFRQAVEAFSKANKDNCDVMTIMRLSDQVVMLGSALINAAMDHGMKLSKSDIPILNGVANLPTHQRLKAELAS
jgi:hypothetical protein